MKTMSCDLCPFEASGETFSQWMEALKPHYADAHHDFMEEKKQLPQEQQMAEMQNWMKEQQARFDAIDRA